MPKHIEYLPIASFGEIITGKTPSTSVDEYWYGDIPFITPTDIIGYNMYHILKTERYVSTLGKNSQIKTVLPAHSICVSCIASIGKICITQEPYSITNQQINSIIVNDNYDYKYIYYCFRYYLPYLQLIAGGTGAGTPIISKNKFARLKYPVHVNVADQRCIASVLSAYDDLIENNNKRIKILEQMAQELYKEWFVRLRFPGYNDIKIEDGLPADWEIKKLSDFGISLDTGSRPTGGIDASLTDGVPSLGAEAINALAEFDYSSVKLVPVDFYNSMKRGRNTGNDILVYKDGAYIGKVTLFRNEFPYKNYAVNEHVFLLKPTNELYLNYLYFTLHQDAYFYLMQNLNRNAAQPGLSREDIKQIKITVPSETTIKRFNDVVEPILNKIFVLAKQNANLAKQRDLLLPRLMSGKLEIKGTDDA